METSIYLISHVDVDKALFYIIRTNCETEEEY